LLRDYIARAWSDSQQVEEKFRASASDQHPSCDRRDYTIAKTLRRACLPLGDFTLIDADGTRESRMLSRSRRDIDRAIPFCASHHHPAGSPSLSVFLSLVLSRRLLFYFILFYFYIL